MARTKLIGWVAILALLGVDAVTPVASESSARTVLRHYSARNGALNRVLLISETSTTTETEVKCTLEIASEEKRLATLKSEGNARTGEFLASFTEPSSGWKAQLRNSTGMRDLSFESTSQWFDEFYSRLQGGDYQFEWVLDLPEGRWRLSEPPEIEGDPTKLLVAGVDSEALRAIPASVVHPIRMLSSLSRSRAGMTVGLDRDFIALLEGLVKRGEREAGLASPDPTAAADEAWEITQERD